MYTQWTHTELAAPKAGQTVLDLVEFASRSNPHPCVWGQARGRGYTMPHCVSSSLTSMKQCCRSRQLSVIQGLIAQLLNYPIPPYCFLFPLIRIAPRRWCCNLWSYLFTNILVGQILETIADEGEKERTVSYSLWFFSLKLIQHFSQ